MFRRTAEYIRSNDISPEKFVEGYDQWNSELMYLLDNETDTREYLITKYEKRIDLISKDIYGEEKYSWILLHLNRVSVDELVREKYIKYIPKDTLDNIINNL